MLAEMRATHQFYLEVGAGVLVGALKRVRLLDGDLRLVIGEPRVRRVLEVCDLDRVFAIHTDLDSAVAAA